MNDKVKQLYDLYVSNGLIKSVDFNTFSNASEEQRSQLYNLGRQNGLFETTDFNTFSSAFGGQQQGPAPYATGKGPAQVEQPTKQEPLKKKEPTSLVSSSATTPSVSQEEPPKITDYLQQPAEETKIQAPYAEGKEPVFIKKEGEPVQNLRQLTEEQYASEQQKAIESGKITPAKISGKETFIPTIETKNLPKEDLEENYFKGSFGNVLKGFDEVVPLGIGDFIDDMARSVSSGYRQGVAAKDADRLLLKGSKATPEQIQKFIESQKAIQQSGPSAEMQDYQRIYEKEGKGFWGVIKGLISNPSVIPELITSSLTAMATNTDALTAASSAIGTGASIGAAAGAPAGGIGAIPGAAAGATASIPYAFGLASSIVEAGSTFGELIQEELNGQEFTKENVKKILEDPTKLNKIRNKAIARGLIIGTVDAFTGKLASGVGAKIIERGAAKSATGVATRGTLAKATAAGAGVEALGGSGGEAIARGATGQEMDISEISLEGLAELPSGIRSTIQARLTKPTFRVNGERVNADQVDELINTMTPDELSKTNIEIKNDFEGRKNKIQDKIITGQIKKEVQQANPNIEDNDLNQLVDLEKELRSFENNKTQSGKDRAADIRLQIKNIQQNAVQKQAAGQVPVQPTTGVGEKVEEGKPTTESEVVTEEGVSTEEKIKEIERRRQEEFDQYANDIILKTELYEDGENRKYLVHTLKNGKKRLDTANEEGKRTSTVNVYESSVPVENYIMEAKKISDIEVKPSKQENRINAKYDAELASLKEAKQETIAPKVEEEVTPTVLANVENTSTALESVPVEEKMDLEFTQEDGTVSPVNGNERMLSDMYHKAVALPEDQRTEPQKQVVSLVEQSLSNDIEVERLERELAKPEVIVEEKVDALKDVESTDKAIDSLPDEDINMLSEIKNRRFNEAADRELTDDLSVDEHNKKFKELQSKYDADLFIGEAYHKAKKDGSNPELVKAVEDLLSPKSKTATTVGISISNDTDIENLKNTTRSKAQAARTESEKKSAETKVKILETAQRAIKAIKNIFPDIDIVIHDNEESYNNEVRRLQGQEGSGGNFAIITDANGKETRRIDINLSKANERTVAHETTHALLEKAFGDDPKLFQRFKDAVSKILSAEKNEELNKFIERYTNKEVRPEEYLVELAGMLEQQETTVAFKPSTLQKIAELINKFVSAITNGKLVPFRNVKDTKDIVEFLNTVSGAIRGGEAISIKERERVITPSITSKAQLTTEGTGISLLGNETVIKGTNSPTVNLSTDKETKYSDDYTFEDIQSSDLQPSSRAVTLASKVGSGEISYKKQGETKSFVLPYLNKELSDKINRLREKYKSTKDKVQKEKIKKEINNLTKQIFTEFKNIMTQNLLALYDSLTPEFIEKSKQWYVGANRMANAIAKKYNLTVEQVSGIIGVLSPQKDWFNNVSAAERVVEIMSKYADRKITKDLIDKAVAYNSDKRTGEPNNWANVLLNVFSKYGEISINEAQSMGLSEDIQSTILRAFDQSLHSPRIPITDPNGKFIGYDTTPIRWNSNSEIATAISIFRDGSQKNIDIQLGNGNKVRNFYNNIVDPNSETPYVTADTHALSAALNSPISAEDAGGIGLFNGANEPMYALVKAAYIDAARIAGIKPREMQSITWEAQRIGINDKNRTENQKSETFNYIKESRTNKKTPYERASELIAKNRSANPSWGRTEGITTQRTSDEIRKSARLQAKQRASQVSSLRGEPGGGIGKPTTGVGKTVAGGKGVGEKVKSKAQQPEPTEAPKYVRDISVLITPATVRGFDTRTERIKDMSIKYDKLVKEYATDKSEEKRIQIKELEDQILNDAKQEIIDEVNKIPGLAVKFEQPRIGLWDGAFEPSFNMTFSVTPQADTKKISDLLMEFGEKYSQDAFILETQSEQHNDFVNGKIRMPLNEEDSNGLANYPQIIYTFAEPISDEKISELSTSLQANGIDAFSVNNNELKISVLTFLSKEQEQTLSQDEQYAEKFRDFESKSEAAEKSVGDVLGSNALYEGEVVIKKSHYQGANKFEKTDKTRQYDRRDVLKPFQQGTTEVEALSKEFSELRKKQIEGKKLTEQEQARFNELESIIQPVVEKTFEANQKIYEQAKNEVEDIAEKSIEGFDASISPFPIKKPQRASVKTLRWYSGLTENLGDGARVNVIVKTDADADALFDKINEENPVGNDKDLRRINEETDLSYPKRLIEVRTPAGVIAEMQVITEKAYLAKDGMKGFTGGKEQKASAKKELDNVRNILGWNIPDGLGHYFYEIQRDTNIDQDLRDEAKRLSNLYYDAFVNEKSDLKETPFMNDVMKFKERVDKADKKNWDKGNEGKAPESLTGYKVKSKSSLAGKDINNVIKRGRAAGVSERAIRTVLKKQGFTDAEIDAAMGTEKGAAKKVTVSEEMLPGFNRMMEQVDGIVTKSRERGVSEDKVMENVMRYVEGSKAYENASDVQREQIIRDIEKRFGVKQKAAPKVEKLLDIKDTKNITMSEKEALVKQIKDQAKGAKEAKSAWVKASAIVSKIVSQLKDKGKISVSQMTSVIRRFSSVNMFNDDSISRFVDYMSKVFADATYADRINNLNSKISAARKNIKTKLGIADGLMPSITRLFSINPSLIPDNVLDKYESLVEMMGRREQVLRLDDINDVTKTVNEILTEVDNELSLVEELADRLESYPDKVIDNGKLDYSATINNMVSDGTITDQEAELMKKYKSKMLPKVDKPKMTDQEIEDEKNQLIDSINQMTVDSDRLPTREERDLAQRISKLIKTKALYGLTNSQLKDLIKTIDNINNGYLTHYAQLINERMNAIDNSSTLKSAIDNAKPLLLTKMYNKVKSLFTRKNYILEMIRRNPLAYIDQVFGNFKTKEIFNSLFDKLAKAHAAFKMESKRIQDVLDNAQDAVAKSFKYDANKTLMSKFKMMTYLIQLEYESNKGSKQVNKASDFIKATIKHIESGKSQYGQRDADMLQKILDQYVDGNGDIDLTKLYNSFNQAEREAIGTISKVNQSLRDKAVYTASIIRGQKINPLTNYIHLNVLHEHTPTDVGSGVSFANDYNNTIRPSTKAKSLIERTGKVSPLNFDVFASAQRGANFVLTDFYLTEPIRTARKTLNETNKLFEEKGKMTKLQKDVFNSIDMAFEEAVSDELINNFTTNSFADEVINYMSKTGYRAILSSTTRFISELSSNIGYAMFAAPKDFAKGIANKGIILSANAIDIMKNVGSKQISRIFPTNTLSGKLVDTSIMSQASGIKGAKSKNTVANKIQQIYNLSGKKYVNAVELISDALISTPDKMVMRPIWFGAFANEFKKITGNDIDFDKLANNDEAYISQNKEAIDKATSYADDKSVMAGATDNAFMGILKGKVKPDQSSLLKAWNMFNGFMTRFLIYEYVTARTGVMAAMGNGSISRKQGAAVLAGVTTRMVTYSLLSTILGQGLISLFSDEEDEEEDDKSFIQKFGQSLASSVTGLLFGRDFGNAVKTTINYGVEKVNEKYLDFLREGEYDPYKDAIQYSIVPAEKKGPETTDLSDLIKNMMGPFAPAYKTADLAVRKIFEKPKKKEEAIKRQEAETNIRVPLEVAGNLGLVPLYKDIRKIVLNNMYSSLKKEEKKAEEKKETKEKETQERKSEQAKLLNMLLEEETDTESVNAIRRKLNELGETKEEGKARRKMRKEEKKSLLKGYENMDDMKRYNPKLYEETFGEESPYYEKYKDEFLINKEINKLERKIKDEEMEYVPQPKKRKKEERFGSEKFGGGGFGEGGFGSKGF